VITRILYVRESELERGVSRRTLKHHSRPLAFLLLFCCLALAPSLCFGESDGEGDDNEVLKPQEGKVEAIRQGDAS
jgi:hypothetical protein